MSRIALCCSLPIACVLALVTESASSPPKPTARTEARDREPAAATRRAEPAIDIPDCRVRLLEEVQLACARTGIVDSVASEGEHVSAGDIVGRLRDDLLRVGHAIARREAANNVEVRFAKKASELAQVKYGRAVDANKASPGTVSELELRELRLAAEKSLLQIEQAEHQFSIASLKCEEAEETLNSCRVAAPFDGTVIEVYKRPGEVVREGEVILRLASDAKVRVEGFVSVEEASQLRRGMPVRVALEERESTVASADEFLPGRLAFVDIKVEPVSRKVRVWAEVANPRGLLRDGLTATLTIPARPKETDSARR